MTPQQKKPSKIELLDKKDRLNKEFWEMKEKAAEQYQVFLKERSKYIGLTSKLGNIESEMLKLIKEYREG